MKSAGREPRLPPARNEDSDLGKAQVGRGKSQRLLYTRSLIRDGTLGLYRVGRC